MRQLVEAGHEVTGMTSRSENAAAIEAAGATARRMRRARRRRGEAAAVTGRGARGGDQPAHQASPATTTRARSTTGPPTGRAPRAGHNLIEAATASRGPTFRHPERRLHLRAGGRDGQGRGGRAVDRRAGAVRRRRQIDARPRARGGGGDGDRRPGAALRAVLRAGHLLRLGRKRRRAGASTPLPDRRRRPGHVLVHPRRGRRLGHGGRRRPRGAGHLQRRRRRARAGAGLAAGLRRGAGRKAAPPGADLAGADRRRAVRGDHGDRAARRLQREGQARTRLGAAIPELEQRASREALG